MFCEEKQFYIFLRNFWVGQQPQSANLIGSSPTRTQFTFLRNRSRLCGQFTFEEIKWLSDKTRDRFDDHFIGLIPMQPYFRLPILSSLCFAALNSSLDVLSWCEVRRAWEIESAKFILNARTKPQIQSSQINDVTIIERLALSSMNFCLFSLVKNKRHEGNIFFQLQLKLNSVQQLNPQKLLVRLFEWVHPGCHMI